MVSKAALLKFIAKAHKNTYAAPRKVKLKYKCKTPILPGHKDYDFKEGPWRYHDSYSGEIFAPGKEVVFFEGEPVWCMAYQGKLHRANSVKWADKVYDFLKLAMMNFDEKVPFRGPGKFKRGDFEYIFKFKGDYKYFVGREAIKYKDKEAFFQDIMGEIIK